MPWVPPVIKRTKTGRKVYGRALLEHSVEHSLAQGVDKAKAKADKKQVKAKAKVDADQSAFGDEFSHVAHRRGNYKKAMGEEDEIKKLLAEAHKEEKEALRLEKENEAEEKRRQAELTRKKIQANIKKQVGAGMKGYLPKQRRTRKIRGRRKTKLHHFLPQRLLRLEDERLRLRNENRKRGKSTTFNSAPAAAAEDSSLLDLFEEIPMPEEAEREPIY